MTKETLRFQELLPERDDFELEDGTKIPFVARAEMDGAFLARLTRVMGDLVSAGRKLTKKPGDERALAAMDANLNKALRLILPDLPGDLALGPSEKTKILDWWRERNFTPRAEGEAQPG